MYTFNFKGVYRGINYSQKRLFSLTKAKAEPSLHGLVQTLWSSNKDAAAFEYFNSDSAPAEADFKMAWKIVTESTNT